MRERKDHSKIFEWSDRCSDKLDCFCIYSKTWPTYQLDPNLVCQSGWNTEEAYQAARGLLKQRHDFTAIVAGSDLMAIGVLRALHEQNFRVPDDISLAGFDDVIPSQYTTPPLTTIRQEREIMGKEAIQRLIALIEGKETGSLVVPTRLVARQSTGPITG